MRLTTTGLGIGTTNPQRKLHIVGDDGPVSSFPSSGTKDFLVVENEGNANVKLVAGVGGLSALKFEKDGGANWSGIVNYSHVDDSMWFATDGAEKLRISSSGNVGVGTVSPSEKLHVSDGNILLDNNGILSWKTTAGTIRDMLKLDINDDLIL